MFRTDAASRRQMTALGRPQYTVRVSEDDVQNMQTRQKVLRQERQFRAQRDSAAFCCRMLGVINGRDDFAPVTAVAWDQATGAAGAACAASAADEPPTRS